MLRSLLGGSDLVRQGAHFQRRLAKLKSELGEAEFPWYPYESLGNIPVLDRLLQGQFRSLLNQAKGSPMMSTPVSNCPKALTISSWFSAFSTI